MATLHKGDNDLIIIIIIINLRNIPGKGEIKKPQKTVVLGNAHVPQKVLM